MLQLRLPRYYNPVLVKELRSRMRGGRAYWLTFFYLALLAGLFAGFYAYWFYDERARTAAELGRNLFTVSSITQIVLVAIIVPALTAGMITLEKEQKTYELLAATGLTARNIVCGKLVSALLFVALLALTSLPFTGVSFFFGGVSPIEMLSVFVLLLSIAFAAAAIGIFFSSILRHTSASFAVTYVVYVGVGLTLMIGVSGAMAAAAAAAMSGGGMTGGPFSALVSGGGPTFGVTIPIWVLTSVYIITIGFLLIVMAIERMEHFNEDKSLAKRLVSSGLYIFTLLLIFAITLGAMPGASPDDARTALVAFLTVFFAIVFVIAPIFLTGELTEPWRRGLLSYLGSGFSPRQWLRGTLRGGMPFLLVWVVVGGALLRFSFGWSGTVVPDRSWALYWVDLSFLVAFLFGLWGIGVFFSAALRGRSQAMALTYVTCVLLIVIPLVPLIWGYSTGARPFYNLLYFNPFFALWEQGATAPEHIVDTLRFSPIPVWKVTSVIYLVLGAAGLLFATPMAAAKMARPKTD